MSNYKRKINTDAGLKTLVADAKKVIAEAKKAATPPDDIWKGRDSLHFRWAKALSYNKTWNFVIGERESGKSVDSWVLIYNAFHYLNRPSIILRRRIADITDAYIKDTENLLNKFLREPIQLVFKKGSIKEGIVDVRIGEYGAEYSWQAAEKLPLFFRVIGLSNPLSRIKSLMLPNIKYMFIDEFICNLRGGEKYLKDEHFLIQEIYTTYNREAITPIKILGAGNPYSTYCSLFVGLGVQTNLLKPGKFIVGDDYVIDCFQAPPELKEMILRANPMYQFDNAYKRYAFGGEAVNDANIKLCKCEPRGFKLKWVFKFGANYISIHERGRGRKLDHKERYWVCKHGADWSTTISKRRNVVVFDFGDMSDGTVMASSDGIKLVTTMASFKKAMGNREVLFNCIDASYMAEDLYFSI